MHDTFSLTVSESKRLIARGVAADPRVVDGMDKGRVAIVPGTTNGYVIEEMVRSYPRLDWMSVFSGDFDRTRFVAGRTLPKDYDGPELKNDYPAILAYNGTLTVASARQAAEQLEPGDVFIKGVNAINYQLGQAGVLIGHPEGGNVGEALGAIIARKVCFLHPVGLEKHVAADLNDVAAMIDSDPAGSGPTLWVVPGPLFTEIEAISVLTGARAFQISSGGVGGAEGAVWIAAIGSKSELHTARRLIDEIRGEPPFVSQSGGVSR
jgi:hypothetical protein